MKENKRRLGAYYEEQAARLMEEGGLVVLERNYRTRYGEIDIIARDGSVLVFAEVKFRKNLFMGHPLEAVDLKKQRKIRHMAAEYLVAHDIRPCMGIRFDVIGMMPERSIWVEDAF